MRDLTVLVRSQNGILAQGVFDVVLHRLSMVFEEVPPGASRLVRPENNASQTGAQARLVVQESFFDANGLPATLAISIAADILRRAPIAASTWPRPARRQVRPGTYAETLVIAARAHVERHEKGA